MQPAIEGELKKWHRIDLTFDGPQTSETASDNPFLNYRLNVTFTNGSKTYVVPGYYAADGNAAETSASSGNKWRVHFTPDEVGTWTYTVSSRQGTNVAVSLDPNAGTSTAFDGVTGTFAIAPTNKTGDDLRGKGRLEYVGERYLQFAETGEYFIKGGANSPENFLAYYEFDNTIDTGGSDNDLTDGLHRYAPHVADWQTGDPTWQGDEGKGIIGALNYLASEDMNAVYFLTYNTNGGDGSDVFPWIDPAQRTRFDVSKLEQWEVVFSHMDVLGLMLHVVTQETENDQSLGGLTVERRLYYRELVARFGHHLAMQWNLGEENDNTEAERRTFADYIQAVDPYDHPIVIHNIPWEYQSTFNPLMGNTSVDGASFQISKDETTSVNRSHDRILEIINNSIAQGRPWIVTLDETGPFDIGVAPDSVDPSHDRPRKEDLWGTLMAGGAGVEWYFGYAYANGDLDTEDWRSRNLMWDQTRYALNFFQTYLPFTQMRSSDGLTSATSDYVLAKPGDIYAIYLPNGGTTNLTLPEGNYSVRWFNPRTGGTLQSSSVTQLIGNGSVSIGQAPNSTTQDWVALVRKIRRPTATLSASTLVIQDGKDDAYTFTVTYENNVLIDVSTLDDQDVRVTGPNQFSQVATLMDVNFSSNGTPRTATYAITPSGNLWDEEDEGIYWVYVRPNQVEDIENHTVPNSEIGSFQVDVTGSRTDGGGSGGGNGGSNGGSNGGGDGGGGKPGSDHQIKGTSQRDRLEGTPQKDTLMGLGDNDTLLGLGNQDRLLGGNGQDRLIGGRGNDVLHGGVGGDRLMGGRGADIYRGGAGRDVFVIGAYQGRDKIIDFRDGSDQIDLAGDLTFRNLQLTQQGQNTLISFNDNPIALLRGIKVEQITTADFILT